MHRVPSSLLRRDLHLRFDSARLRQGEGKERIQNDSDTIQLFLLINYIYILYRIIQYIVIYMTYIQYIIYIILYIYICNVYMIFNADQIQILQGDTEDLSGIHMLKFPLRFRGM